MNTVTWDSLDVSVQLIVYTLAGTSTLYTSQYFHMYTGKEIFPSIAYEVICTSQNSFRHFYLAILELEMLNT